MLLFVFFLTTQVFASPESENFKNHLSLFSLEYNVNDSKKFFTDELIRNYRHPTENISFIERQPFDYLPNLVIDLIYYPNFLLLNQFPLLLSHIKSTTDDAIVHCSGLESNPALFSSNLHSSAKQEKEKIGNFQRPFLGTANFSYSYRFTDSIFSWGDCDSLAKIKEKDALIPTALLDAILRSNYELFFLQKQVSDEELHAIYLNILHGSPGQHIAKTSSSNFGDFTFYLLAFVVVCLFIQRYLAQSQNSMGEIE